ncbi:MAG: protein translocase subunit SecF [Zetaproteobacteria bacterium]|nr:MAG: protein translocase subunit SecF [Zetaproteobacteria bacterium]
MELIPSDRSFDFVGRRKLAFVLSTVLVLGSLALLFVRGLNFGIDFTGGTLVEARFTKPPKLAELRRALDAAGFHGAVIQEFGSAEDILVRVPNLAGENSNTIGDKVLATFRKLDAGVQMRRVEYVGPQVGRELAIAGVKAVVIALVAILLYVTFRFELRFALGADLALVHDTIITIGAFSLTGKEVTLPVVAALLTIIGYSLNDTIVVFDRIRELFAENRKRKQPLPEAEVANRAINETLPRTVITSLTTLLVVLALFFLGGEVIHDFAFALIVGIVVGTYSSIFVATPLMLALSGKLKFARVDTKELEARP